MYTLSAIVAGHRASHPSIVHDAWHLYIARYYCFFSLHNQSYYREIIAQDFIYKQNYHNVMELPKIEKLVIG